MHLSLICGLINYYHESATMLLATLRAWFTTYTPKIFSYSKTQWSQKTILSLLRCSGSFKLQGIHYSAIATVIENYIQIAHIMGLVVIIPGDKDWIMVSHGWRSSCISTSLGQTLRWALRAVLHNNHIITEARVILLLVVIITNFHS